MYIIKNIGAIESRPIIKNANMSTAYVNRTLVIEVWVKENIEKNLEKIECKVDCVRITFLKLNRFK